MAEPAHVLIDVLLQRVRDPQAAATSRADVRRLLGEVQRAVNLGLGIAVNYTMLDLDATRTIYPWPADHMGRLIGLRQADTGRDLVRVAWREMVYEDPSWFHAVGPEPMTWAPIGRSLLAITPAPATPMTLQCVFVEIPVLLVNEASETLLPDEHLPPVLDLTEALLLLKLRRLDALPLPLQRLAARSQAITATQARRVVPV